MIVFGTCWYLHELFCLFPLNSLRYYVFTLLRGFDGSSALRVF
jgi:hypothetical protein